jgi:NADPH-dependent 7-cyano-7-deazaguanine reductase QueF-like protein
MVHADKPIGNPLGETLASPSSYAPEVLFPIARDPARKAIGLSDQLAMHGFDHWQAFRTLLAGQKRKALCLGR